MLIDYASVIRNVLLSNAMYCFRVLIFIAVL